MNNMNPTTT